MKSGIVTFGLFLFVVIISCKKDKHENDFCINRIFDSPRIQLISEEDFNEVKSLFVSNNLDYSNFQFFKFQTDNFGYHHARCYPFINNLKVFTNDLIFHFDKNNNYKSMSGHLVDGIDLDSIPSMDKKSVIEKYLNEINNDEFNSAKKDSIIKNCFELEFGYYDLNAGKSFSVKNFTKAWKVYPKAKVYPFVYVNDMTSNIIYYDNGIRY
jgi:Zn-dependent metalloprotease